MNADPWRPPDWQPTPQSLVPLEGARTSPALRRSDAVAAVVTGAALTLLGAPVGLLWAALAPRVDLVIEEGTAQVADAATKAFIGADGVFLIIAAVVGLVSGVVAYLVAARHGPGVAVGLAVGGVAGSWVARCVGRRVHVTEFLHRVRTAPDGTHLQAYVTVRATGVLLAWSLVAVVTYTALVLWATGPRRAASWDAPPTG